MKRPLSLTFKLSALFAAASLALIVTANTFQFYFLEKQWHQYENADLAAASEALVDAVKVTHSPQRPVLSREALAARIGNRRIVFKVEDEYGREVVSTFAPEISLAAGAGPGASPGPHSFHSLITRASFADSSPATVIVALDVTEHARVHAIYRRILIAMTVATVLLAALLGHFVARQGLAALHRVSRTAREITASRLGERLPLPQLPVELRDVAESFNAMLSRLQDSFRRLEDFAANLAHELRTPINNLLGHTQVALARTRTGDEYRSILESNTEEFERLARMIEGILFLARADDRRLALTLESVDLALSMAKLADYYEALLEVKGITLIREGRGEVQADRLLVERVLHNLLSNAVRHTPSGGEIHIAVAPGESGTVRVHVTNSGAAIPDGELPRIFERFYRTEASKGKDGEPGVGLGLAIARSIMYLHGGDIIASCGEGKTCFTLVFPGSSAPLDGSPAPDSLPLRTERWESREPRAEVTSRPGPR